MENYLLFSSFAFIYLYNIVIASHAGRIYVFEDEIRKASTFCEEFLVKPPESLITFKLPNAFKIVNKAR